MFRCRDKKNNNKNKKLNEYEYFIAWCGGLINSIIEWLLIASMSVFVGGRRGEGGPGGKGSAP